MEGKEDPSFQIEADGVNLLRIGCSGKGGSKKNKRNSFFFSLKLFLMADTLVLIQKRRNDNTGGLC